MACSDKRSWESNGGREGKERKKKNVLGKERKKKEKEKGKNKK